MTAVAILDTTVLCEILDVPGKAEDHRRFLGAFRERLDRGEQILLPVVTVVECGNHIGQCGDGSVRRRAALRFAKFVTDTIEQCLLAPAPWDQEDPILNLLKEFPDWAKRGSGFGDLAIRHLFDRQCVLNPRRRVYVWSKDRHLAAFDRQVG